MSQLNTRGDDVQSHPGEVRPGCFNKYLHDIREAALRDMRPLSGPTEGSR